ncbi:MAG: GIY-YIG catalytic domain protein [Candidatus Izimaplasma bacterium HR2]|nr:MAG: GIY-YIG catalytic domain protein [Candidatus Izimaplasma bacterium HR2]
MIIYKVTNVVNGKIYIGQTTKTLQRRKTVHYCSARCGSDNVFAKSLMKYDKNEFKWKIICECDSLDDLNEKEIYYIKENNSLLPNGYNMTGGGFTSPMINPSDELREKHKIAMIECGKKMTGDNNPMKRPEVIEAHRKAVNDPTRRKKAVNDPTRRKKHSQWMKENYRHTDEEKQKRCKYFLVVKDTSNKIHIIKNLKQWCRDNPYYSFGGVKSWAKKKNGKPHKGLSLIYYTYKS